jgi:hypothetical protein
MNRSYRDEGERDGRGPGLIGEKTQKTHGYDNSGWRAVDKMLSGAHPTTNLATVACAGNHTASSKDTRSVDKEQRKMVDHGKKGGSMRHKFAAGGVGKVRKGEY